MYITWLAVLENFQERNFIICLRREYSHYTVTQSNMYQIWMHELVVGLRNKKTGCSSQWSGIKKQARFYRQKKNGDGEVPAWGMMLAE